MSKWFTRCKCFGDALWSFECNTVLLNTFPFSHSLGYLLFFPFPYLWVVPEDYSKVLLLCRFTIDMWFRLACLSFCPESFFLGTKVCSLLKILTISMCQILIMKYHTSMIGTSTFSFILTSPSHFGFCFDFLVWKSKAAECTCVPVKDVPLPGKLICQSDTFYLSSILLSIFNLFIYKNIFFYEFPGFPGYTMHMFNYFCLFCPKNGTFCILLISLVYVSILTAEL